jgi:hypothetical protein
MDAEEKALRREDKDILDIKITNKRDKKPFVFISYKSDDWKKVLKDVVFKLQKKYGLRVYFDKDFDDHSRTWINQFYSNMKSPKCRAVLAFLSNEYYVSYATLMEMMCSQSDIANLDGKRKLVIPVNLEDITNRDQDNDDDTGLGTETYPNGKKNHNWKEELSRFDELYTNLRKNKISTSDVYKPQRYGERLIVSTNCMEDPYLEKRSCKAIMTEIWAFIGMNIADGSNKDICESLVRKLKNAGYEDVFDESLIDPKINWSDFERTNKILLDEPEKDVSYKADNNKTAVVTEITTMPSASASANDLRSKLIEKLGGDEVKSKAVFWIKDNKKFRLRSTTSTINNNKPNEQYDYLICEIKGKYGVFSSDQEREKIAEKDLDLNFDGLIKKIKEKLEEETKNGNRTCPTSEEKDDKNSKNEDEENNATPIDLGKALNDYKHLAEVFIKTYEKRDPKRIECFKSGTVETLKWDKDGRYWAIVPQMGNSEPIPEGELLTAIETLASNFRSNEKHLWKVFLRYDRLFDCTGTDFELYVREEKQRRRFFITGVVESKG